MAYLLAIPLALAIDVPLTLWKAVVVQTLWVWFVTPSFGLAAPSLWMVFGLILMVGLLKRKPETTKAEGWEALAGFGAEIAYGVITPLIALFLGAFALWMAGA